MLMWHAVGRTGRAGREGKAVTYFTDEDAPFLKAYVPYSFQVAKLNIAPLVLQTSSYNPGRLSQNGSRNYRSHPR